jgi:AcrR family transcriptional regulator
VEPRPPSSTGDFLSNGDLPNRLPPHDEEARFAVNFVDQGDHEATGPDALAPGTTDSPTRDRILVTAMSLMSAHGVQGTSMRDLASEAGLNVASLYHYFPSKSMLVDAVIGEQGERSIRARIRSVEGSRPADLVQLMAESLGSMMEAEASIRLMMGESMQGGETARVISLDLHATFLVSLREWLIAHRPEAFAALAPETARLLGAVIVGTFFEHLAGLIDFDGEGVAHQMQRRAEETLEVLNLGDWN